MNETNPKGCHDFAFQTGSWRVRHRKLRRRLAGSKEWFEFEGRCEAWEIMGGDGNIDDHFLDDPAGAYHAATFRRADPDTGEWLIWWADGRCAGLDPPMRGAFDGGIGLFYGHDRLEGRPIDLRFVWSREDPDAPRWEQAFSADGGRSWETNWIMHFTRSGR
jgi:hypothetical protein